MIFTIGLILFVVGIIVANIACKCEGYNPYTPRITSVADAVVGFFGLLAGAGIACMLVSLGILAWHYLPRYLP